MKNGTQRSITNATSPHPDSWWDVDADVLSVLADGAKSPEAIGESLGMSADAVTSLVSMLAQAGKLRIRLVEAVGSTGASRASRSLQSRGVPVAGEAPYPSSAAGGRQASLRRDVLDQRPRVS